MTMLLAIGLSQVRMNNMEYEKSTQEALDQNKESMDFIKGLGASPEFTKGMLEMLKNEKKKIKSGNLSILVK